MREALKLATIAALLGIGACASSNKSATTQPMADAPINKYCAVNTSDEVDPKVFLMYQGKKIGFCCPDCVGMFQKDPETYMKTLK